MTSYNSQVCYGENKFNIQYHTNNAENYREIEDIIRNQIDNERKYNIINCCIDTKTLIALEKRAEQDLKNNTHNIGQEEVITIIREFIRYKNDRGD